MNAQGRYCRGCRFYHGRDNVVCGVHPYGKESSSCLDFVPQVDGLNPVTSTKNRIDHEPVYSNDPSAFTRLFSLILLVFVGGVGLIVALGKTSTLFENLKIDVPAGRLSADWSSPKKSELLPPESLP